MFFKQAKEEAKRIKAFKEVFYQKGKLSKAGEVVLATLRDEAGGRGELGRNGLPYFYDAHNRFDENAGAFLLGKRRMFDLIIKYLALDEREVFNLSFREKKEDDLEEKVSV